MKLEWVGENEIGAVFYHPEDAGPPYEERVPPFQYLAGEGAGLRFATHYKPVPAGTKSPIET